MKTAKHELIKNHLPLIAILRGIRTEEAVEYVSTLIDLGYFFIEVPLNSPNALETIKILSDKFGSYCCIGAGTVTNSELLNGVLKSGAKLVVTPNVNKQVIKEANKNSCVLFTGIMTPSEAFSAINAGATMLKIFPADILGFNGFKAIKSILPPDTLCFPVGGITADLTKMQKYIELGADGFGLGNSLYYPKIELSDFIRRAKDFIDIWHDVKKY
ncbi:2-dehydro-3-deoxy-6-phosphogalactonate aldolase [Pasteurella testudinis]|uniref:2-dehydro-3-deoxy-6-phosphogalactonate aldolase n=1 Tax=Pasteurella testudinis TaxID=761 RepID=UPI004057F6BE